MIFSMIISVFAFLLMLLFIFFSESYIPETKNALMLFLDTVFPTMFPFYVLSSIIVSNKSISVFTRPFKAVTKLYNLPTETSCAIFLGLLCGFPIGAKVTCDLLKNKHINQKEAAILAAFTNNASPVFLISLVGRLYLKNQLHGLIIWLCVVFSSLLSGFFLSKIYLDKKIFYCKNTNIESGRVNISESIISGFNTSLYVGAIIIFFSSITALIKKINFLSHELYIGMYSFLEMSGGLNAMFKDSNAELNIFKYIAVIAIVSWSGMCVHLQICGILKSNAIKTRYYFLAKVIQTFLSICIFIIISVFVHIIKL